MCCGTKPERIEIIQNPFETMLLMAIKVLVCGEPVNMRYSNLYDEVSINV